MAAIGNPENFFELLKENKLQVEKKLYFQITTNLQKRNTIFVEAEKENLRVIMTEKDYFKVKKYNLNEIRYLKISIELKEEEKFFENINRLYEKNI